MRTDRLLQYAFSAVSLISLPNQVQSQISYTDVDPDEVLVPFDVFYLDVNADGFDDFRFQNWKYGQTHTMKVDPVGSNELAYATFSGIVLKLNYNAVIGGSLSWSNAGTPGQGVMVGEYFGGGSTGSSFVYGNWYSASIGYLPIRTTEPDGYHYGWIRMSLVHAGVSNTNTIFDFAINETPNEPIMAGVMPCLRPAASTTLLSSGTEVRFNWDLLSPAIGYQLRSNEIGTSVVNYDTTTTSSIVQTVNPGSTYRWQIRSWCGDEFSPISSVEIFTVPPILKTAAPSTEIAPEIFADDQRLIINLPQTEDPALWKFTLVDISGRTLLLEKLTSGSHTIPMQQYHSGAYFAVLERTGEAITRKIYFE